ncbi:MULTISPECIES: protein TolR [Pseudomonas]|uniref:Tol-Pal system protein TolR n=1 Tax=Pseudomonas flexibilis TaxID=706570 RepID=A0A0B3BMH2_9PSED|nr:MULTISPECIES: protein TolR [Pseudomonas]KHL69743.1 TolR protein [Pseudomonas flexibilis]KHO65638.1 biopolymer transporter TolR [Pseudomonas flexibilis]SCX79070.1 biopolymer transport protein TolR [Pseudomonas flexibilis]SIQ74233.1 Cell division and transport-associated protein TolR [Pseudomonas flexibilis]
MARIRNRRKPVAEMNVVPYIDVMLVLLVIFMVTAPMLNQGVKVDLPKVSTEVLPQDNNARVLTVSIKADRTYYWNMGEEVQTEQTRNSEAAVSLDKLVGAVRGILAENSRQGKKVQVYVRGDKAVDYGAVMAVMGGLQQAGVGNVGLITEAP